MSKACGPWWCPKQTAEPWLLKDMEPRNVPGHRRRWPAGIDVWSMAIMLVELFHRSQHVAESATAQQIAVFRVPTTHWRGLAVLAYMCPLLVFLLVSLLVSLPASLLVSLLRVAIGSCAVFFFASLCPIVVLLFVVISSFLHGFYWELSCLMASLSQGLPYCVSFLVSLPPPIIAKTNTNP